MEQKLKRIFSEVLGIDAAELESHWEDGNLLDSLKRINLLFVIEDEFDLLFEEDELKNLTTPKALAEAAMRKCAGE